MTQRSESLFSSQLVHVLRQREQETQEDVLKVFHLTDFLTKTFPRFGMKLKRR